MTPDAATVVVDCEPASRPAADELSCPRPGVLPFRTTTCGELSAENANTARAPFDASYGLDVLASRAEGEQVLSGAACRSSIAVVSGCPRPVRNEHVAFWTHRDGAWAELGRTTTDDDGRYAFTLDEAARFGSGEHRVYAVFEGTQTCAEHGVFVYPEGTEVVLTDIDGTLTANDEELIRELTMASYVPIQNPGSSELMRAWADKGYVILYVTGRPHDWRARTRSWLGSLGFPRGPLSTAATFTIGEPTRVYKREFLSDLLANERWSIVAAYGNATTDVLAYGDVGLPKETTFTVGEAEGMDGTVGVPNGDWTEHTATYVAAQPDAEQP